MSAMELNERLGNRGGFGVYTAALNAIAEQQQQPFGTSMMFKIACLTGCTDYVRRELHAAN